MRLKNREEQLKFLEECHKNIIRIFNTYLTASEKDDKEITFLAESDEKLNAKLPELINCQGSLRNIKMGKLEVLTAIYNDVATAYKENKPIELDKLFTNIKIAKDPLLKEMMGLDSDSVMKMHRRRWLRGRLGKIINFFYKPTSTSFLKKYGYFKKNVNKNKQETQSPLSEENDNSEKIKTHYDVLGISPTASLKEIRAAYLKLALQTHPDKMESTEPETQSNEFLAVQAAYDTLSDETKRRDYDAKLKSGPLNIKIIEQYYYSSLEDIYKKLPTIIANYTKKLHEKNKELDILYLESRFIILIKNIIFLKNANAIFSNDIQFFEKNKKKQKKDMIN